MHEGLGLVFGRRPPVAALNRVKLNAQGKEIVKFRSVGNKVEEYHN